MALAFALLTAPAHADCPQTGSGTCTVATEVAVALQDGLPVDLGRVRLMFAIAGGRSVVVGALAAADGTADPATARGWLCRHPVAGAYLKSGGRIEVLLGGVPLLDLTTCETP